MFKEEIAGMISELLKFDRQARPIDPDGNLTAMGLDSIKLINMVVQLEERFGIEIDDEDLLFENFATLNKISALLSRYVERKK